ncbi:MAG: DUF1232 domain-containing protein [Anaerolineales bacterium]
MASLRQIGRRVKGELAYYRCLIANPRTPKLSRLLLGAAVAYFVTPVDLIPDFIPVLGQLDDLLIVPGLIWLALRLVPAAGTVDCRQLQRGSIDSPIQRG